MRKSVFFTSVSGATSDHFKMFCLFNVTWTPKDIAKFSLMKTPMPPGNTWISMITRKCCSARMEWMRSLRVQIDPSRQGREKSRRGNRRERSRHNWLRISLAIRKESRSSDTRSILPTVFNQSKQRSILGIGQQTEKQISRSRLDRSRNDRRSVPTENSRSEVHATVEEQTAHETRDAQQYAAASFPPTGRILSFASFFCSCWK